MTDEGSPRTTVVIPVWDRYVGPRLIEAVDSIRSQERAVHLLVVDNASSVPLPDFPDARVVRSPRRVSLGAARNVGLAEVGSANVIFWDADDVMEPGTIAFLEDQLAGDPALLAFGAAIIEEPSGLRHRWPRRWIGRVVAHPRLFAVIDCVWSMFPTTGATVMRTDAVRACGGYADADSGEDWSLGSSLLFRGRVGWSERPGRRYLQHEASQWDSYGGAAHQFVNAAAVRRRLAADPGIPRGVRAMMPLVGLAQAAAIGAHVLASLLRRVVGARGARAAL